MNEAMKRKEVSSDWENLSTDELQTQIKNKVAQYIQQQPMLETDKQPLIDLCEKKIDGVVKLWNDEMQRRNMLLHLIAVPVNEILPSLKSNTVEKLFEMSAVSVKG